MHPPVVRIAAIQGQFYLEYLVQFEDAGKRSHAGMEVDIRYNSGVNVHNAIIK